MNTYDYYDHVNPITGSCPEGIKSQFGFKQNEYAAENLNEYSSNAFSIVSMTDSIPVWMERVSLQPALSLPHRRCDRL